MSKPLHSITFPGLDEAYAVAPGGYGYGGTAIPLHSDRVDDEAELDSALEIVYDQMSNTETKLVYWNGYPAAGTSTHGWFAILTKSSTSNGGLLGWSAYDAGTTIRKTKYNNSDKWQPLETFATTAYADTKLPKAGGTMTGDINMGSKKITNLATPTANTDAVTKAYADIGKLVRLWTNTSPTSSFGAQTVSLTLSGYDYVLVCATWDINNPHRTLPCHIAQVGGSYDGGYLSGRNPSDGTLVGRSMDVTTSGVTFAGGYKGTTSDNKVCIPFAIFGINI